MFCFVIFCFVSTGGLIVVTDGGGGVGGDGKKSEIEWLLVLAFKNKIQSQKGLFILARAHRMQLLVEIPFVKPQNVNDT